MSFLHLVENIFQTNNWLHWSLINWSRQHRYENVLSTGATESNQEHPTVWRHNQNNPVNYFYQPLLCAYKLFVFMSTVPYKLVHPILLTRVVNCCSLVIGYALQAGQKCTVYKGQGF